MAEKGKKKTTTKKHGRPLIEIDKVVFEKLCSIQCTQEEIAGWFNCSEDTLLRFCKREYGDTFCGVYKKFSGNGKISLRRTQMKIAEAGNPAMAIWLGKQYLGQRDRQEVEERGNAPINIVVQPATNLDIESN